MAGTVQGRGSSGVARSSQPSPILAPAPDGLSARRAERWLDLPAGAWQRRRLYALRARSDAFRFAGVMTGDIVVIEPGAREQPGQVVLLRSARGLSLQRIASEASPSAPPSVLELPLRPRNSDGTRIVGTVLAVLRPTGTGALRPVRAATRRARGEVGERGPSRVSKRDTMSAAEFDRLHRVLHRARAHLQSRCAGQDAVGLARQWRLLSGLAALIDCLRHAHSSTLQAALLAEAGATARSIETQVLGK